MKLKNNAKISLFAFTIVGTALLPGAAARADSEAVFDLAFPAQVVVGEEITVDLSFVSVDSPSTQITFNGTSVDSPSNQQTFDVKIAIIDSAGKILSEIYNFMEEKWQSSFRFVKGALTSEEGQKDFLLRVVDEEAVGSAAIALRIRETGTDASEEALKESIEVVLPEEEKTKSFLLEGQVEVPNGCEVVDVDGAAHAFSGEFLGICALAAAKGAGIISAFEVGNHPDFGLFVQSVHGAAADASSEFWALWHREETEDDFGFADCGVGCLVLSEGDEFSLIRTSFEGEESDQVLLAISLKEQEQVEEDVAQEAACGPESIDINSASAEDLTVLDGVGETLARRIVEGRLFQSLDDLVRVEQLGEGTVQKIKDQGCAWVDAPQQKEDQAANNDGGGGSGGGGGGGGSAFAPQSVQEFEVEAAIDFLADNQQEDGSFGGTLFTDWAAVALGAYDISHPAADAAKEYLRSGPESGSLVTDAERRAMALMALGINPYSGTPTNYIAKIEQAFDGEQIGDPDLVNDDIFGLLVLRKAGFERSEAIIDKTTAFVLAGQRDDGSWVGGVDMTAAAVQSLSLSLEAEGVSEALEKARMYVSGRRQEHGGFGDVYSTSWAVQAVGPGDEGGSFSYLAARQAEDGGVEKGKSVENRVWATSYAIPAVLEKSWGQVLLSFEKPEPPANAESGGGGGGGGSGGGGGISAAASPAEASEQKAAENPLVSKALPVQEILVEAPIMVGVNGQEKEVRASLRIAEGNEVQAQSGKEWTGTLELRAVEGIEGMAEITASTTSEGQAISELEPLGAVQVFAGEGVALEFAEPVFVSIPVAAEDGETLHVFSKSELQDEFAYEGECVVENSLCRVETKHLSWFVATARLTAPVAAKEVFEKTSVDYAAIQADLEQIQEQALALQEQVVLLAQAQREQEVHIARAAPSAQPEEVAKPVEQTPEVFAASATETAPRFTFEQKMTFVIIALGGFLLFGIVGVVMILRKRTGERPA